MRTRPPSQLNDQRIGTVIELDLGQALARVGLGDIQTDWVPWLTSAAGDTRLWIPLSIGQQVVVLCPDGDLEAAFIIGSVFCDAAPPNGSDESAIVTFKDGSIIAYDPVAHHLNAALCAGATLTLTADGGMSLTGDIAITGDVDVTGKVTSTGKITSDDDVVAAGKSLKSHKHLGVQAGAAQSGIPV